MVLLLSGISVDRSTVRTIPVPPQCLQAPAELKARSSAPGAKKCSPHSGQTSSPSIACSINTRSHRIVTVGTTMAGKAREHQPQTIQQFRSCAEGECEYRELKAFGAEPTPPAHREPHRHQLEPPASSFFWCTRKAIRDNAVNLSAYSTPSASELFPDPDTPAMPTMPPKR